MDVTSFGFSENDTTMKNIPSRSVPLIFINTGTKLHIRHVKMTSGLSIQKACCRTEADVKKHKDEAETQPSAEIDFRL